ncbi:MAG: 16S rRNA (guanine(966)-N(2))-methyltransferase RsmD [Gemmatimonadaceae bacterium]
MRIVAGRWRGRRIDAPPSDAVRPTADRVREAWLSIVQHDIPDARALDLFAGSGALGIEALSRGAASVHFVEKANASLVALRKNLETLGAGSAATVHHGDAIAFIARLGAGSYDLAFADPPYRLGVAAAVAQHWLAAPFATVLGIEHAAGDAMPPGGDLRRYGMTAITFYRRA